MQKTRDKWNIRYEQAHVPNQVIDVLRDNIHLLNGEGISLDLACGLGGNALRLAELGYESHAWDISDTAIGKVNEFAAERQLTLCTRRCDIAEGLLDENSFDVIIVSRFLCRSLISEIARSLKPQGLIFYQTFIQEQLDTAEGPQNNDFRLYRNELLGFFNQLTIRYYREEGVIGDVNRGFRNEAMLVAQKTA
jgi:SAM-dependent methyltransferase